MLPPRDRPRLAPLGPFDVDAAPTHAAARSRIRQVRGDDLRRRHGRPHGRRCTRYCGDWRPDLVVRESMEYGGCLAAEVLGLPHASIAGNGCSGVDSPDVRYFRGNRRLVADPLARHRAELGLPPDPYNEMPFRYLHLWFMPPAWDGPDVPRPANTAFCGHTNAAAPGTALPPWVGGLPALPTVFASLGTVFNTTPGCSRRSSTGSHASR